MSLKLKTFFCASFLVVLTGCATSNPKDPLESYNRAAFGFNETVDQYLLRPVASGYDSVTPAPVKTGVRNFFSNIDDLPGSVKHLMAGEPKLALDSFARLLFNSTFGVLGIFDIATEMGIEKAPTDFGSVLSKWGVGDGSYIVLPLLGPSTLRDAVGKPVDIIADPLFYVTPNSSQVSLVAGRTVDERANLLNLDKVVDEAALDKYTFVRDAYLQRRRAQLGLPRLIDDE